LKKYGVAHTSQTSQSKDGHKVLMFEKFLSSDRFKNFIPKFSMTEYQGVTTKFNKKYEFSCKRCGKIEEHNISNGKIPKCQTCDKTGCSNFQHEIFEFVKMTMPESAVVSNNRTLIRPLEIDIFIPDKNFAIEADGLYYHSEVTGMKNKNYHLNKTKNCAASGVRLVHIFESEWKTKNDIVKSILKSILVKGNEKIFARNCNVRVIDSKIKSVFLKRNHIQGDDRSTIKLGLYHGDDLKSVMTFVKSRFDKNIEWEMSRYCNQLNVTVVGGGSKLFSYFVKNYAPKSVVSYSDRRYFSGEIYLKLGFSFVKNTVPGYHYIINSSYYELESRINWQKAKLDKKLLSFNSNLTEWENMKANGFDRIWDCGHSKWIWTAI
jgi:ribosomal protein L37E